MQTQEYEGASILFCGNCWGHWLDNVSLAEILATESYGFSREERDTVLSSWIHAGAADAESGQHGLECPICQSVMTESPFADDCPVLVDRCPEHGTWLDAGEIKQVQVFVENR